MDVSFYIIVSQHAYQTTITRNNIWSCKARIHDMNPIQRLDMWNVIGLVFNSTTAIMKCVYILRLETNDISKYGFQFRTSESQDRSDQMALINYQRFSFCFLVTKEDEQQKFFKIVFPERMELQDLMMPHHILERRVSFPILRPKLDLPTGLLPLSQLHYSTVKLWAFKSPFSVLKFYLCFPLWTGHHASQNMISKEWISVSSFIFSQLLDRHDPRYLTPFWDLLFSKELLGRP